MLDWIEPCPTVGQLLVQSRTGALQVVVPWERSDDLVKWCVEEDMICSILSGRYIIGNVFALTLLGGRAHKVFLFLLLIDRINVRVIDWHEVMPAKLMKKILSIISYSRRVGFYFVDDVLVRV